DIDFVDENSESIDLTQIDRDLVNFDSWWEKVESEHPGIKAMRVRVEKEEEEAKKNPNWWIALSGSLLDKSWDFDEGKFRDKIDLGFSVVLNVRLNLGWGETNAEKIRAKQVKQELEKKKDDFKRKIYEMLERRSNLVEQAKLAEHTYKHRLAIVKNAREEYINGGITIDILREREDQLLKAQNIFFDTFTELSVIDKQLKEIMEKMGMEEAIEKVEKLVEQPEAGASPMHRDSHPREGTAEKDTGKKVLALRIETAKLEQKARILERRIKETKEALERLSQSITPEEYLASRLIEVTKGKDAFRIDPEVLQKAKYIPKDKLIQITSLLGIDPSRAEKSSQILRTVFENYRASHNMTEEGTLEYIDNFIYLAKNIFPQIKSIKQLPNFVGLHFTFMSRARELDYSKIGLVSFYARRLIMLMAPGTQKYGGLSLDEAKRVLLEEESSEDIKFLRMYDRMSKNETFELSEYEEYIKWQDEFTRRLDEAEWAKFTSDERKEMDNDARKFAQLMHKKGLYLFGDIEHRGILSAVATTIKANGWKEEDMEARVDLMAELAETVGKLQGEVTEDQILNMAEGARLRVLRELFRTESHEARIKVYRDKYLKTLRNIKDSIILGRLMTWTNFAMDSSFTGGDMEIIVDELVKIASSYNKAFPEDKMDLSTPEGMGRAQAELTMMVENGITSDTLPVFYQLKKGIMPSVDAFVSDTGQLSPKQLEQLELDRDNLPDKELLKLANKTDEDVEKEELSPPLTDEERSRLISGIIDGRYIAYIKYIILRRSGVDLAELYSEKTPQEDREEIERETLREALGILMGLSPEQSDIRMREMIEQLKGYLERKKVASPILGVSPNPGIATYGDAAYWAERFTDIDEMKTHLEDLRFLQSPTMRELLSQYYELIRRKVELDPASKASKGVYGYWVEYMHEEYIPEGKKLKDLTPVEIEHMRNQMKEEFKLRIHGIKAAEEYWKRLKEDEIPSFVKLFRRLEERYPNLSIETMFKNIGYAQKVCQEAGEKLLEELRETKLEVWETQEKRNEMIRHIVGTPADPGRGIEYVEGLKEQEITDQEAENLVERMLKNDYSQDDLLEDMKMKMYWQAVYMTYNKDGREVNGQIITVSERLEKGELGELRKRLESDMEYILEESPEAKKAKRDELVRIIGKSIKHSALFKEKAEEFLPQRIEKELKRLAEKLKKPEIAISLEDVRNLLPPPNVWDVIGYVSRMEVKGWNEKKMEADLGDIAWFQAEVYASKGDFLKWERLFTELYHVRGKDTEPLTRQEKWEALKRFQGTHKAKWDFMNVGEYEQHSHLLSTWLVHFGEVLSEDRLDDKLSQLQSLEEKLIERRFPPGEIWAKK
ncbi:TolC family protein, partial [bacterium]|nr:TolC family protein [bacterium]